MEKYPESVITVSKRGKKEVRILDKRGRFVIYGYKLLENGKMENKKKICLLDENGKREDYFMIPLKDGRILLLPEKEIKNVKVWNEKEEKEEDLF
ncbi:MAG: hypothetical protein J7K83_02890 [Candidatus Aenigmarchaeota archaeon]|nr:hypothetical protein [Candidatus Aenigmarchaeota archaeon]